MIRYSNVRFRFIAVGNEEKAGGGSSEIVVSESGWLSDGGGPETNIDNARIYLTRVGNNRNKPGHLFCARKVLFLINMCFYSII